MTLRISIHEDDKAIGLILEGRLAGPYVEELERAWRETAPLVRGRPLKLDVRNVTYSDAIGKQALRTIVEQTGAEIVTSSPSSEYLAEEISGNENSTTIREA